MLPTERRELKELFVQDTNAQVVVTTSRNVHAVESMSKNVSIPDANLKRHLTDDFQNTIPRFRVKPSNRAFINCTSRTEGPIDFVLKHISICSNPMANDAIR